MDPEESAAVGGTRFGGVGLRAPRTSRSSASADTRAEVLDSRPAWDGKYGERRHPWTGSRRGRGVWATTGAPSDSRTGTGRPCGWCAATSGPSTTPSGSPGFQPRRAPARLRPNLTGPDAILEALVEWTRRYGDLPAMADWDPVRARRLGTDVADRPLSGGGLAERPQRRPPLRVFTRPRCRRRSVPRPRSSPPESRRTRAEHNRSPSRSRPPHRRRGRRRARPDRTGRRGEPSCRRPGGPQRGPHRCRGGGGRLCGPRRRRCFLSHLRR